MESKLFSCCCDVTVKGSINEEMRLPGMLMERELRGTSIIRLLRMLMVSHVNADSFGLCSTYFSIWYLHDIGIDFILIWKKTK